MLKTDICYFLCRFVVLAWEEDQGSSPGEVPLTGSSSYAPLAFPGLQDFRVDRTPLQRWRSQIHPCVSVSRLLPALLGMVPPGLSPSYVDGSILRYTLYSFCWGPSELRPCSLVVSLLQAVGFNLIFAESLCEGWEQGRHFLSRHQYF